MLFLLEVILFTEHLRDIGLSANLNDCRAGLIFCFLYLDFPYIKRKFVN